MTDRIAYCLVDYGMDGKGFARVHFAAWTEQEARDALKDDKNKNYLHFEKRVVEVEEIYRKAMTKLDAVEKLILVEYDLKPLEEGA